MANNTTIKRGSVDRPLKWAEMDTNLQLIDGLLISREEELGIPNDGGITRIDTLLTTTAKTVISAINELNQDILDEEASRTLEDIDLSNQINEITNRLRTATSSVLGLIKLGSDTVQTVAANATTSTVSRSYAVQLNSFSQAVVNVPWTDTLYSLPTASASVLGGVKVDNATITISSGVIRVSPATTSALGAVKVGTGLSISSDGVLSLSSSGFSGDYNDLTNKPNPQTLSFDGTNLSISEGNSVDLSSLGGGGGGGGATTLAGLTDVAITAPTAGQALKYNGSVWFNDTDDTLPPATTSTLGGVKVGSGLNVDGDGTLSVVTSSSSSTASTSKSTTVVFSGNAGNAWYDLDEHGPGLYRISFTGRYEWHKGYHLIVYYDGTTTFGAIGNVTNNANFEGGLEIYYSGPSTGVQKYITNHPTAYVGEETYQAWPWYVQNPPPTPVRYIGSRDVDSSVAGTDAVVSRSSYANNVESPDLQMPTGSSHYEGQPGGIAVSRAYISKVERVNQ